LIFVTLDRRDETREVSISCEILIPNTDIVFRETSRLLFSIVSKLPYTVKKVSGLPVPSRDVTGKLSLAGNY
jgi:hypothetical protein